MFYHGGYSERPYFFTGVAIGLEGRAKKGKKMTFPLLPLPFSKSQDLIGSAPRGVMMTHSGLEQSGHVQW